MPFLRSQTRGEANLQIHEVIQKNPLSSSLPTEISSISEVQLITSTESTGSAAPTTPTMFPFPPAPVICSNIPSSMANIINISNASSESSETSSMSNKSSSRPTSPELERDQSELLNLAMVDESGLIDESPSLQEAPDEVDQLSEEDCSAQSGQVLLQQPETPSVVYNLVAEQCALQEDRDHALHLCLQQFQCYDDEAGMVLRSKVVIELDTLVKQWIRSEGLRKRIPWSQLELVGGKVVSFGSFKLSVVDKESDLDLLCVMPKLVTRENFFSSLYDLLSKKEEVTELRQLAEAYVPVIKMKYKGLEVDLTMARVVSTNIIPEDEAFLMNDEVTKDMDPKCVRSLNGYRATCEILQLVPNVERFRLTLRVVKLWAKKQGLYGNMLGFLGGASWAILVAKACQLAEGRTSSIVELIYYFFMTFATWEWPKPVFIKKVEVAPYPAWNPKINLRDAEHCMPIITTSQPQMNSAFNMCKQNCQLIKLKCQEAVHCLYSIVNGAKPWTDLFTSRNFFEEFEQYLMVVSSCQGDTSLWFGSVESKLRQLAYHVMFNNKVAAVRVWPQPFLKQDGAWIRQMWFFGIRMIGNNSPDTVTEPLFTFEDLCKLDASKLVSPFSSSFHASSKYVATSQLSLHLTKQQLSLGRSDKLSYAAVTGTSSSPTQMVLTNMQSIPPTGYVTSVPILSPVGQPHQTLPYNRVYQTPLPAGMGGVIHNQNLIVYSLSGSQHQQAGTRAQVQVRNIPPGRSLSSPQPGGYPTSQARAAVTAQTFKSPMTPPAQSTRCTRRFHQPPISPMNKFNSPPPSLSTKIPGQLQPIKSEDNLSVRPGNRRQKDSFTDLPDRLRSVSNSSDKFPPPSLNRARVNHQDQLPLLSPSYSSMAGVIPLVDKMPDTSVPPPSLPSSPVSLSPPVSFNIAKNMARKAWRSNRSPRVSISEIADVNPPQPVRGCRASNNQIKFSLSSRSRPEDNVFTHF